MTHMICEGCEAGNVIADERSLHHKRKVASYYGDLRGLLRERRFAEAAARLEEARELGIRASDLAIGVIAPLYHFLTETWSTGVWGPVWASPAIEQVARLLEQIIANYPELAHFRQSKTPQVLLLVEERSRPNSGLQIVELGLASREIHSNIVELAESDNVVMQQLLHYRASTVAFVVSSISRFEQIEDLAAKLGASRRHRRPNVLVATTVQCWGDRAKPHRGLTLCFEPLDILRRTSAYLPNLLESSGIYPLKDGEGVSVRVEPCSN